MSLIWICGVDEAGRGPLVGSVVAGAVVLDPNHPIVGLKDSKKLTPARREFLYEQIMEKAKAWGLGEASPAEIDDINILQATMLAMRRAVEDLSSRLGFWPDKALIDGNRCPELPIPSEAIIKGDSKYLSIAAASILAKADKEKIKPRVSADAPLDLISRMLARFPEIVSRNFFSRNFCFCCKAKQIAKENIKSRSL